MKLRRPSKILLAIIGVSLVLRVLVFSYYADTALVNFPEIAKQTDMHTNWEWSSRILAGDNLGRETYHPKFIWMTELGDEAAWSKWWGDPRIYQQEPLYVYVLAFARLVVPSDLISIPLLQLLLGGVLLPLGVFFLGRELLGSRTGLYAAGIVAVFGPGIFYQCAVLRDWTVPIGSAFTLGLAIRAIRRKHLGLLCIAGLMLGVGAMMKTSALLWLPVFVVWLWFSTKRTASYRQTIRGVVVLFLGFALGVAPLVGRNLMVGAPAFSFSNRLPEGLIQGNASDAFPVSLHYPSSQKRILQYSEGSAVKVVQQIAHGYVNDPRGFLRVQGIKLLAAFSPVDFADNLSYEYGKERMPPLRFCPSWGVLVAAAIPGLAILLILRRGRAFWVGGMVVANAVALLLPIALGRYRLEALPLLALCAAQVIRLIVVQFHFRRWINGISVSGLVLGLFFLSHFLAGESRFQIMSRSHNEFGFVRLQCLHIPNRSIAMRWFLETNQALKCAEEIAGIIEKADGYSIAKSFVIESSKDEIYLFMCVAYDAINMQKDKELAGQYILRARKRYLKMPVQDRPTLEEMTKYFAKGMPLPAAQKFAALVLPIPEGNP